MSHHTPTKKNTIAAQQLARVRLELQRSKVPMRAAELAQRAGLDVSTTTTMLVRLRAEGVAWEAGKAAYSPADGKTPTSKTITLWAWHTQRPVSASPAYIPHRPSTQPNGSVKFWSGWSKDMNAHARLELNR